jgi:hypothetical protein
MSILTTADFDQVEVDFGNTRNMRDADILTFPFFMINWDETTPVAKKPLEVYRINYDASP